MKVFVTVALLILSLKTANAASDIPLGWELAPVESVTASHDKTGFTIRATLSQPHPCWLTNIAVLPSTTGPRRYMIITTPASACSHPFSKRFLLQHFQASPPLSGRFLPQHFQASPPPTSVIVLSKGRTWAVPIQQDKVSPASGQQ
jgi:hypothetical protein